MKKVDYLYLKLQNKTWYEEQIHTGTTEQDVFDSLTDAEKDNIISYNNASSTVVVGYFMGKGYSLEDASNLYAMMAFKSIEANAAACKSRFENKASGWFPILFAYFSEDTSQQIVDAIRNYLQDYIEFAKFGVGYGDSEIGILNFINNTGGVVSSLEDYPLKSGSDYTAVQLALTQYFYE